MFIQSNDTTRISYFISTTYNFQFSYGDLQKN